MGWIRIGYPASINHGSHWGLPNPAPSGFAMVVAAPSA